MMDFRKLSERVVLNENNSSKKKHLVSVPRGSVLAPILFLIDITDLPDGIKSICKFLLIIHHLSQKFKPKVYC